MYTCKYMNVEDRQQTTLGTILSNVAFVLSLSWSSPGRLVWLGSSCLHFASAVITSVCHYTRHFYTHFYGAVIMPIPAFSLRFGILENLTLWVLSMKHVGYIIPWIEGWMGECMHAYVYV